MDTKTKVQSASYTLFLSSDEKAVKYSSQCEAENSNVLSYPAKGNTELNSKLSFTIPVKFDIIIESRFRKEIYKRF